MLTLSPLLLEKYLNAAKAIISRAVPMVPKVVAEQVIPGRSFRKSEAAARTRRARLSLSYYEPCVGLGRPSWSSTTAGTG